MKNNIISPQRSNRDWLFQLANQLPLSPATLETALNKLGILPDKERWLQWLTLLLLGLGSGLFLSGILFFFAYNWEEMHRFSRFAVLLVGIIATAGTTLWTGIDTLVGKLLLTAAAVLTGIILATFGMVYQTGADSFMLFRGWFILILPWVLISRFQPLWLIALVIINIAFFTWMETMLHVGTQDFAYILILALSSISIVVILLREFSTLIYPVIAEARWFPRLVSVWLLSLLTYVPLIVIFEESILNGYQQLLLLLYLFVLAALSYYAFMIRRDLLILASVLLSIMTVFLVLFAKLLPPTFDNIFTFLLMGLVIAGATTMVSKLLIGIAKKWKAEEALS